MSGQASPRRIVTEDDRRLAERYARGLVIIIDDDAEIVEAFAKLIAMQGYACETYTSARAYLGTLEQPRFNGPQCILSDVMMPDLDGLALQKHLASLAETPMLLMSGNSGPREVATAFRAGAQDFLVKPVEADQLLQAISAALASSRDNLAARQRSAEIGVRIASLTSRERQVALRVAQGHTNPDIARDLGIALRTVKLHRQHAMEKLGLTTLAELVLLVKEAGLG